MRRALRLGIFIGTIIGMTACASVPTSDSRPAAGAYGSIAVGRAY